MPLGRREAIVAMGAGLLMAKTAGAAQPAPRKLTLDSMQDRFRAYMMMRGALDEQLVIGYVSGSYYGVVGAEVTPLWDVIGATFARFRKRADGGYDGVTGEIAHFLDPATGEAPGRFLNPYTGKWNVDPRRNLPPNRITMLPTMDMVAPRMPPGMQFDHVIKAPEIRGDDVWITEVTRTGMAASPGGNPFHYSEMVTLHSSASDLARTDVSRVPCATSFTNVVDWRPWMEMAGHPGHLTAVGNGRYGVSMADLPERWTAATRKKWPQYLNDPAALLAPLWNS
jgi:hypothetical protein